MEDQAQKERFERFLKVAAEYDAKVAAGYKEKEPEYTSKEELRRNTRARILLRRRGFDV